MGVVSLMVTPGGGRRVGILQRIRGYSAPSHDLSDWIHRSRGAVSGRAVALTMPAVAARLGTGRAAAAAAFGIALSLLPIALIPHFAAAGLGYVGVLVCGAILAPALNVYLTEITSSEWLSSPRAHRCWERP